MAGKAQKPGVQRGTGRTASWQSPLALLAGLLASSCCVVQLAFNLLSLGCAGFAVLDQYRPWFLALTGALLVHMLMQQGITRRTVLVCCLAAALASSNSLLSLHNKGQLTWMPSRLQQAIATSASQARLLAAETPAAMQPPAAAHTPTPATAEAPAPLQPPPREDPAAAAAATTTAPAHHEAHAADHEDGVAAPATATQGTGARVPETFGPGVEGEVVFSIPGIKCEGCAASLKEKMRKLPGVLECAVDLEYKQVDLLLDLEGKTLDGLIDQLEGTLEDLGYEPSVLLSKVLD